MLNTSSTVRKKNENWLENHRNKSIMKKTSTFCVFSACADMTKGFAELHRKHTPKKCIRSLPRFHFKIPAKLDGKLQPAQLKVLCMLAEREMRNGILHWRRATNGPPMNWNADEISLAGATRMGSGCCQHSKNSNDIRNSNYTRSFLPIFSSIVRLASLTRTSWFHLIASIAITTVADFDAAEKRKLSSQTSFIN